MSGGLKATAGGNAAGSPTGAGVQYADAPATTNAGMPQQSHLDSFFEGSGWTREDALLVANVCSLLILLYWAQMEVQA